MLSNFQLTVISPTTGQVIRVFDSQSFTALHYSIALNDIGALVVTFDTETDYSSLFPLDALIDVHRTSPITGQFVREETYLARLTHRLRESDHEQFIVGGVSLNHLLARRVVDPADDPLQAGGYSTKSGAADSVMREYAREQMVIAINTARNFPSFSVATVPGIGIPIGRRLRYENLLVSFQEMALRGGVDFAVRRVTGRAMELTIAPIGEDKTYTYNYPVSRFVMFDPARGNLINPSIVIDRKTEGNYIYALGQGPGSQRITLQIQDPSGGDSPFNRCEFKADIRQAERNNALQLLTEARSKLRDEGKQIEFTFDISGLEPGSAYHVDWEVGDRITAQWDAVRVDLRIIGVEFDLDEGGETLKVQTELP
jgi:ReqiPepy6 Gp37-like protein